MEKGTGRAESWNTESRAADREAAALTRAKEKVSARSLGITGGTERRNIHVVTGGNTEHTLAARKLAWERGLKLVLFAGGNLDIGKGGVVASARAYIEGNRVYVRADHPVYTADQLMRHEAGHDMIARREIDPNTVRERIGEERAEQVSRMYAEAYEGSEMTPEEIWEEIICDSLGDMNIFAGIKENIFEAGLRNTVWTASDDVEIAQSRGPPERDSNANGEMSRESKWRPDLTRSQLERLRQWVKYDIKTSTNSIGHAANWTFHVFDGLPVFAIYSTVHQDDPTILYEVKGDQAIYENKLVEDWSRGVDNGSIRNTADLMARVKAYGSKSGGNSVYRGVNAHTGNATGNVGVDGGARKRKPGRALLSCLKNLCKNRETERDAITGGSTSRELTNSSTADPVMVSAIQESVRAVMREELE